MSELPMDLPIRSGSAPFRARARLIRLLGEELISDEIMALVELVKNAYDADACHVAVRFLELTDPATACIEVQDDGNGMDLETVLYRWLEPATNHKRGGPHKQRTRLGRFPLGEKGVGRFAADKIGSELELVTRAEGADEEIVLRVSWHHFDGAGYLDQIENQWEVREPAEFSGKQHGTLLRMRCLRAEWNGELLARIRDGLMQLTSPHGMVTDFTIEFDCPGFPDLSGPVTSELLKNAPYQLTGWVDEEGIFTPDATDEWSVVDVRLALRERFAGPKEELRAPVCGSFRISLYVWDLDSSGLRRAAMDRGLRDVLRTSCGVRIYRDGFRIWPYGERDDDWLELNQRRVNNPTLRVSNNQVVGYIEITQHDNPDLRDRTSREGLIDTPAFFDLKALILGVLEQLEERRFTARREDVQSAPAPGNESDDVLRCVDEARATIKGGSGWLSALQTIEQTYRQQMRVQQNRYEYVARLAGLGLAAERMTTAFADEITDATMDLRVLLNDFAVGAVAATDLPVRLQRLANHLDSLNELLDLMGPLYRPSRAIAEPLDAAAVAQDTLALFAAPLRELGGHATVTQDRQLTIHMNRAHLTQVLLCLLDNSVHSLRGSGVEMPELRIHVFSGPRQAGIIVADNGPGVRPQQRKLIFRPYFSGRQDGAGLGLHVARDILARYNSTLELQTSATLLPGASFIIRFDRRRVGRAAAAETSRRRRAVESAGRGRSGKVACDD